MVMVDVVFCKECRFQQKAWYASKCCTGGGYYRYWCTRNPNPREMHTVNGYDEEYCSSGIRKE